MKDVFGSMEAGGRRAMHFLNPSERPSSSESTPVSNRKVLANFY